MDNNYSIKIAWSDDDEAYVALIPEFEGLSAFGDDWVEAAVEAQQALKGFIKIYEEDGKTLPENEKIKTFSGQLRLRLPKSLHQKLALEAQDEGTSLNQYIVYLLSEGSTIRKVSKNVLDILYQSLSLIHYEISSESDTTKSFDDYNKYQYTFN